MSVTVSVAVLNYQRRDALRRALEAARQQRWPSLEIIAVDNASTDGSTEMVRDEFPDVHLVALPRNIAAAARNEGKVAPQTWTDFLTNASVAHAQFLEAHERAARIAAQNDGTE